MISSSGSRATSSGVGALALEMTRSQCPNDSICITPCLLWTAGVGGERLNRVSELLRVQEDPKSRPLRRSRLSQLRQQAPVTAAFQDEQQERKTRDERDDHDDRAHGVGDGRPMFRESDRLSHAQSHQECDESPDGRHCPHVLLHWLVVQQESNPRTRVLVRHSSGRARRSQVRKSFDARIPRPAKLPAGVRQPRQSMCVRTSVGGTGPLQGSRAHILPTTPHHRTGLAVITLPPNAADSLGSQSRRPGVARQ